MNPSEPPRVPLDAAALRRALVDDGPYSALDVTARTASTNDDLAAAGAAHLTVLAAEEQTAGRGRLGRVWAAPPASSLLVSVAVRPPAAAAGRLTWLPLVAGLATQRAARTALAGPPGGTAPGREHDAGPSDGAAVPLGLAWPNDVVADLAARGAAPVPGFGRTRKLAGILCQTVPLPGGGVPAVVIGIGLNVSQTTAELPVPSATSLAQL
ncbi:MAG: hypothetical protein LBM66_00180, partial [Bifidobacteriaceae bacterium]|nr:hypothetical protein [Bifidobacteriaceae bacterium]